MSCAKIIWQRECKSALRSPVAWCIFSGFTALVSLLFTAALRAGDNTFEHLPAMFCVQVYLCLLKIQINKLMTYYTKDENA